jgi:hypothetical protein
MWKIEYPVRGPEKLYSSIPEASRRESVYISPDFEIVQWADTVTMICVDLTDMTCTTLSKHLLL